MPIVPSTENSLLVRTSFADAKAWADALSVVRTENEDGFRAYVEVIDDNAWEDADWEQVRRAALATDEHAVVLFIVDSAALEPDYPVLVVMRRDRAVVFDVSSIDETETDLQAAILLACWSYGFGTVNVANALADAGLEPRRNYFVVLDELWRALRAGKGMVDRVDALTRLNRSVGVGQIMISHTMSDLLALPAEEDRMKARGFVERSGMVICGGLPASEMPLLTSAIPLSRQEQQKLISWQDPPAWDSRGLDAEPPGRGKFLIKFGGRPGIPVLVCLTSLEQGPDGVNDTEGKWRETPETLLEPMTPDLPPEGGML